MSQKRRQKGESSLIELRSASAMANFSFRFVFRLILLTKINIDQRTTCKWFFPQSKSIVEEEVFIRFQGQPLESFYVGLLHFGDKKKVNHFRNWEALENSENPQHRLLELIAV